MFVVILDYLKDLNRVDQYLAEHRAYLDQCYKKDIFVVSGPQVPRTGGVLISALKHRAELEEIIKHDPFYIHQIAEYKIIEFNPVKYHTNFEGFII